MATPNPCMAYVFCYAQCRSHTSLNHTDAKALDVRGMCGFGIGVVFRSTLILNNKCRNRRLHFQSFILKLSRLCTCRYCIEQIATCQCNTIDCRVGFLGIRVDISKKRKELVSIAHVLITPLLCE